MNGPLTRYFSSQFYSWESNLKNQVLTGQILVDSHESIMYDHFTCRVNSGNGLQIPLSSLGASFLGLSKSCVAPPIDYFSCSSGDFKNGCLQSKTRRGEPIWRAYLSLFWLADFEKILTAIKSLCGEYLNLFLSSGRCHFFCREPSQKSPTRVGGTCCLCWRRRSTRTVTQKRPEEGIRSFLLAPVLLKKKPFEELIRTLKRCVPGGQWANIL